MNESNQDINKVQSGCTDTLLVSVVKVKTSKNTSNHHNRMVAGPLDSIVSAIRVKTFADSLNEHCNNNVMVVAEVVT